jgi:hypothetical protein
MPRDYYANYLQNLSAVNAADLQSVARRYIHPDSAYIIIVGNRDAVVDTLTGTPLADHIAFFDTYGNEIKISAGAPLDVTARQVVDKYIAAIGGREKLEQVDNLVTKMKADVQSMTLEMTTQQKAPDKFSLTVAANGMVMSQQKYNSGKGVLVQGGQKQPVEGEDLERMAQQAMPFQELSYGEDGYRLELKGSEQIDGENAYKVEVTTPSGDTTTEYYSVDSGLKLRVVQSNEGPAGPATITFDFSDYQEVDGIRFPHTTRVSGMLPIPLELKVEAIEVNKGIENAVFNIE